MDEIKGNRDYIGKRIAEIRQAKGLSIRQLADASGVNFANIYKIENGKYNVSIDILGKICEALGYHVDIMKNLNEVVVTKEDIKKIVECFQKPTKEIKVSGNALVDVMMELKNDCDLSCMKQMREDIDKTRADYFYKPSIPEEKPKEILKFNSKKEG